MVDSCSQEIRGSIAGQLMSRFVFCPLLAVRLFEARTAFRGDNELLEPPNECRRRWAANQGSIAEKPHCKALDALSSLFVSGHQHFGCSSCCATLIKAIFFIPATLSSLQLRGCRTEGIAATDEIVNLHKNSTRLHQDAKQILDFAIEIVRVVELWAIF